MAETRQTLAIQQAIDLAAQHLAAGGLSEAGKICQQILESDPDQPVALHLFGLVAHQEGRNDTALDRLTKAVRLQPDYAEAHNNLGNVLRALGRLEEALASYQAAFTLAPEYAEANNNVGVALLELGKLQEAEACHRKTLDLKPDYPEASYNLGLVLRQLGRSDDAVVSFQEALRLKPDFADAHNTLGKVLHELGRLEEAEQTYRTVLRMKPNNVKILVNLGDVIKDIAYRQRCCYQRESPSPNSASLTTTKNLWDEVLFCTEEALSQQPSYTGALALKSAALLGLNRQHDWDILCDFDRLVQTQTMKLSKGYADLRTFNDALFRRCANSENRIFEPPRNTIRNGHRISSLQKDSKTSPVSILLEFVKTAAERYRTRHPVDLQHPYLTQQPVSWEVDAWGSILRKQGYHESHIHPRGWLSGVYYGILPEIMKTENAKREGCIEFGRPNKHIDDGNSPEFPFIRPHEGLMLLFPSYFYHRTIPFDSDGTRFTISFDLIPSS